MNQPLLRQWWLLKHHRRVPAESQPGGSCSWRKRDSVRHIPPAWIHSTWETAPWHRFSSLDPWRQHLQASISGPKKETQSYWQSKVCKYLILKISTGYVGYFSRSLYIISPFHLSDCTFFSFSQWDFHRLYGKEQQAGDADLTEAF